MSLLPTGPLVRFYNGILFPLETETVEATASPNLSSCGRHVVSVTHALTIRAVIGQANQLLGISTDTDMAVIRGRLTAVGRELHFESVGYGPITVQVPAGGPSIGAAGTLKDVMWGPRPQLLRWKPMGQAAAEIEWRVSTCIACEPDGPADQQGIYQWCWKWATEIDRSGYTTRRINGFIQVPGTLDPDNPRVLTDQADRLREAVLAHAIPLPWFRREVQSFDLDEAKTRLTYQIVDIEMPPNLPPEGAVDVQAFHSLASRGIFGQPWRGTLTATYEVSRDRSRADAEAMFWRLVQDRVHGARNKRYRIRGGGAETSKVFGISYEAADPEIHGRKCASFRMGYTLHSSLEQLAEIGGLWRPVPGGDNWNLWANSLAATAFAGRGSAGLRYDRSYDALIDLCGTANRTIAASQRNRTVRQRSETPRNETPEPDGGFLAWLCLIRIEREDSTVELKPLPPQRGGRPQPGGAGGSPGVTKLATASQAGGRDAPSIGRLATVRQAEGAQPVQPPPPPPPPGDPKRRSPPEEPTVQRRAAPTWHAILYGGGLRAGFPMVPPELVSVGGCAVVPANDPAKGDGIESGIVGVFLGVPVFWCSWRLRYLILGDFDGAAPPPPGPPE